MVVFKSAAALSEASEEAVRPAWFGRSGVGSAHPRGHVRVLGVRSAPRESKVGQLRLHVGGEEDVGRLEVTVDDLRGRGEANHETRTWRRSDETPSTSCARRNMPYHAANVCCTAAHCKRERKC